MDKNSNKLTAEEYKEAISKTHPSVILMTTVIVSLVCLAAFGDAMAIFIGMFFGDFGASGITKFISFVLLLMINMPFVVAGFNIYNVKKYIKEKS